MSAPAPVTLRNRIVGLEYLERHQIEESPDNWRIHPPEQKAALKTLLEQVGVANAVVVYKTEVGTYRLIDGHLRREMLTEIPALVLDVTEQEARVLLAGMDSIAELRERDNASLQKLLEEMEEVPGLEELARQLDVDGITKSPMTEKPAITPVYPIAPSLDEGYDYVLIFCRHDADFNTLHDILGLERSMKRESKSRVGLGRVIPFDDFMAKWRSRPGG